MPPAYQETWILDIPEWQFQSVLTKLNASGSYRRSKTVNATAFLATEIDNERFAKAYRDVPELDTLILHIRCAGIRLDGDPGRPAPPHHLSDLPPAYGPPVPAASLPH